MSIILCFPLPLSSSFSSSSFSFSSSSSSSSYSFSFSSSSSSSSFFSSSSPPPPPLLLLLLFLLLLFLLLLFLLLLLFFLVLLLRTALHLACAGRHDDIISHLCAVLKEQVNCTDSSGSTPIHKVGRANSRFILFKKQTQYLFRSLNPLHNIPDPPLKCQSIRVSSTGGVGGKLPPQAAQLPPPPRNV